MRPPQESSGNSLFPDGSTVRLSGDTALLIRFTTHARTIELDRGEAFFN